MNPAPRHQSALPIEGYLIIDPTTYTPEQHEYLQERAKIWDGWQHPDGVRWIIPVQAPATTRATLTRNGLPPETIQIAR